MTRSDSLSAPADPSGVPRDIHVTVTSMAMLGGHVEQVASQMTDLTAPPVHQLICLSRSQGHTVSHTFLFLLSTFGWLTDKYKITFIVSLLSYKTEKGQWEVFLSKFNSPVWDNYQSFTTEMWRVSDHPVQGREADNPNLQQGTASVTIAIKVIKEKQS